MKQWKQRALSIVVYSGLAGVGILLQLWALFRSVPQHYELLLVLKPLNVGLICFTLYWFHRITGGWLWAFLDLRRRLDTILGRLPWLSQLKYLKRFRKRFLSPSPFRLGYRFWHVHYDGKGSMVSDWSGRFTLESVSSYERWVPGPNVASCIIGSIQRVDVDSKEHLAPVKGCYCGLWSRSTVFSARRYRRTGPFGSRPTIIGATANWGKIVHHSNGQRAEVAMVIALLDESRNRPERTGGGLPRRPLDRGIVQRLAEYYDVPVFDSVRELKRYAKGYLQKERNRDV